MFQKTIKKLISFSGTGLHTGKENNVTLKPAPVNTGLVFVFNNKKIKLTLKNVAHTIRSIAIGKKKDIITTVEHISASIYMSGITNIYIEIDNLNNLAHTSQKLGVILEKWSKIDRAFVYYEQAYKHFEEEHNQ